MQGSAPSSQPAPLPGGASLFLLEPEVGFPILFPGPVETQRIDEFGGKTPG